MKVAAELLVSDSLGPKTYYKQEIIPAEASILARHFNTTLCWHKTYVRRAGFERLVSSDSGYFA